MIPEAFFVNNYKHNSHQLPPPDPLIPVPGIPDKKMRKSYPSRFPSNR